MWAGSLAEYDDVFDRCTTRNEKALRRIENREFYYATMTDDPVIEKLAVEGAGTVYAITTSSRTSRARAGSTRGTSSCRSSATSSSSTSATRAASTTDRLGDEPRPAAAAGGRRNVNTPGGSRRRR